MVARDKRNPVPPRRADGCLAEQDRLRGMDNVGAKLPHDPLGEAVCGRGGERPGPARVERHVHGSGTVNGSAQAPAQLRGFRRHLVFLDAEPRRDDLHLVSLGEEVINEVG